jgi:hypothetical protein
MWKHLRIRSRGSCRISRSGTKPVVSFNSIYNSLAGSGLQDS